jgi:predicted nucleic acid-binding protein
VTCLVGALRIFGNRGLGCVGTPRRGAWLRRRLPAGLPVSEAVMDRALEVQKLLAQHRGNGHRRPIPDLIIAATAELHGAEVLHVDSDYDLIAEVTGQPMRRLLDPGHA